MNALQIELLSQFKPLTPEMRMLLLDMQKVPGLYAEGVILGENYKGLFRNIPPRTALALALTDPDERAHLARIQEEQGFETELETVMYIAEQMKLSVKANNHLNEVKFI